MSASAQIKSMQQELDRRDKVILDMRLSLIESRLNRIEDLENRLRAVEIKATETRTIVTLAFGTGILSLGNLLTQWLK